MKENSTEKEEQQYQKNIKLNNTTNNLINLTSPVNYPHVHIIIIIFGDVIYLKSVMYLTLGTFLVHDEGLWQSCVYVFSHRNVGNGCLTHRTKRSLMLFHS